MTSKALVLDANILIRAVFGQRVRSLIHDYAGDVSFYVAEQNVSEAEHYIAVLAKHRGLALDLCQDTFRTTLSLVGTITADSIDDLKGVALARIQGKDPNDWPTLATAMRLDCPIWTEDRDFFGTGVAVWTTETVEIYLRSQIN